MKRLLALSLAAALLLAGCAQSPKPLTAQTAAVQTPAPSPAVDTALTDLGLSLLRELRAQGDAAPLLSPLSVGLALSMAANGAQGDTLSQLTALLGDGVSLEELNAACAGYLEDFQNLGDSTRASIANSVWADPAGMIREDFLARCQGVFQAEVFQEKLSDPSIVGKVNGWISDKTSEMIPEMVREPFQDDAAALLINALYLKNQWETPFSPNATGTRTFYRESGGEDRIDFLQAGSCTRRYVSDDGVQGTVLPYDDGRLAFFALMPDDLDGWLERTDGAALQALLRGAEDTLFLHLALPKFQAEWNGQLEQLLAGLGAELAFQPGEADFSALGDAPYGYYIRRVIHAAKIEVNEEGTEAAAATVVEATAGGAAPEEGVILVLDHPFVYGICDLETGMPLFLGVFR